MPANPSTYAEVEEEARDRIQALDGSVYNDGTWRESPHPITVIHSGTALSHLGFSVWIQSAFNTDEESDNYNDGYAYIECRLNVSFLYRLRPGKQTDDARAATNAAIDVTRALMAQPDAQKGCIEIRLVEGLRQALSLDGMYLLITQEYTASFDLRLDPTPTSNPP